jgi:hypothetical protein
VDPVKIAVVKEHMQANPFIELQKQFGSYYKIKKHCTTSPAFKYIESKQVTLPNNSSFQYISIKEIITAIVNDPSFVLPAGLQEISVEFRIRDVKDGTAYKENVFFSQNPTALTIIIYSDALELCNPLGPAKGVHKIVNIYFTLAEIEKNLRSKTENFFLTLTVKESDLKQFRKESSFFFI